MTKVKLQDAPTEEIPHESETKKVSIKRVKNIGTFKVELPISDTIVVVMPGKYIELPLDYVVPSNINLVEQ